MEVNTMNQFTIEFKNPKDLADKISKYNDLMNPKPISELAVPVLEEKPAKPTAKKQAKEEPAVIADPVEEAAPVEEQAPTPEPVADPEPAVEAAADVPVTDFNGEPIAEDPTELDVEPAEFDPAAYWVDFKSWLKSIGNEGIKKALEVFRSHGVEGNPSSDDLTPEIVAELDALMKGE
jgi:putative beta-N-acetylhexosaminidase